MNKKRLKPWRTTETCQFGENMTRYPLLLSILPLSSSKCCYHPLSPALPSFFAQKKKGKRRRLCSFFFSLRISPLKIHRQGRGGGEEKAKKKKKKKKRRVTAPLFLPLPSLSFALCHTKAPPTPIKQGTQITKPPCPKNVLTHVHTVHVKGKKLRISRKSSEKPN